MVRVFAENGKPHEDIYDVKEIKENENCFSILSLMPGKGKRKRYNKQFFSKPEFCYEIFEED